MPTKSEIRKKKMKGTLSICCGSVVLLGTLPLFIVIDPRVAGGIIFIPIICILIGVLAHVEAKKNKKQLQGQTQQQSQTQTIHVNVNSDKQATQEMKYCQLCGKQIKKDAIYCEFCGGSQE
jgi:ABC-type bacteriocin/lantibiotic exporter with double-glycine peptidase domain